VRIAITGVGLISALGATWSQSSEALLAGESGIGPVTLFDSARFRTHIAAEAKLGPDKGLPPGIEGKRWSRTDRLGHAALHEALAMAGLDAPQLRKERVMFSMGVGVSGLLRSEYFFEETKRHGLHGANPNDILSHYPSATIDRLLSQLGVPAASMSVVNACSSSTVAIGFGAHHLDLGLSDFALVGGADSLCRITYAGFNILRAVGHEPCRPFDRNRAGLTLGEGAGMLVLEREEHARARGAKPIAYVTGFGMSCDAHHPTAPDPQGAGAVRALTTALRSAGLSPDAIEYVNAHGTATPQNDVMEANALKTVFTGKKPPVSSTKGAHGHCLGAAGGVEAAFTIAAMRAQRLPPTLRFSEADPGVEFDFIPEVSRPAAIGHAVSQSFGFGGNNGALVFTHPDAV
jgi:3-oxoacyl-[acyl-carrier-protein] synthase II